jgi:hypothetical protein
MAKSIKLLRNPLDLLKLARRHETSGEGQETEDDLGDEGERTEGREGLGPFVQPQIVFRGTDEPRGQAAEGMGQRRPLRHRGQGHFGERDADRKAERHRQRDPMPVHDAGRHQGPQDGQGHGHHTRDHALAGGPRVIHPVESENEQSDAGRVDELDDGVSHDF